MAPPERASDCSLLLIYRPRKDERLSWLSWMTYSGRFTHTLSSDAGRAQDRESSPAKHRRSGVDLAGLLGDAWRAPKVGRCRVGWGYGEGCSLPSQLGVWSSLKSPLLQIMGTRPPCSSVIYVHATVPRHQLYHSLLHGIANDECYGFFFLQHASGGRHYSTQTTLTVEETPQLTSNSARQRVSTLPGVTDSTGFLVAHQVNSVGWVGLGQVHEAALRASLIMSSTETVHNCRHLLSHTKSSLFRICFFFIWKVCNKHVHFMLFPKL